VVTWLFWVALPAAALLPAVMRWRAVRAAVRRDLARERGRRWMLAGLGAGLALFGLTLLALVFETRLELPAAGLAVIGVMMVAAARARPALHPGLHGFGRTLPRDGLELVDLETGERRALRRWLRDAAPAASVAPVLALCVFLALRLPERSMGLALLGLAATAPFTLIPWRWLWVMPVWLAFAPGMLLWQAARLQPTLPPGWWASPVTEVRCTGAVRMAPDRPQAWCVEASKSTVFAFNPASGLALLEQSVPARASVLSANAAHAWLVDRYAPALVRAGADGAATLPGYVVAGAVVDRDERLWVFNISDQIFRLEPEYPLPANDGLGEYSAGFIPGGESTLMNTEAGLLGNFAQAVGVSPSGDVWVGSLRGANVLEAGASEWRVVGEAEGVRGPVLGFAFGLEGEVWLLWGAHAPGGSAWGVSVGRLGGKWEHWLLGAQTQAELPLSTQAMAIDRQGRVWLATQSLARQEKLLVVVSPGEGAANYPLGAFPATGPYAYGGSLWREGYGVLADGRGGIVLRAGAEGGWRWLP
jgi:hypothetical protein